MKEVRNLTISATDTETGRSNQNQGRNISRSSMSRSSSNNDSRQRIDFKQVAKQIRTLQPELVRSIKNLEQIAEETNVNRNDVYSDVSQVTIHKDESKEETDRKCRAYAARLTLRYLSYVLHEMDYYAQVLEGEYVPLDTGAFQEMFKSFKRTTLGLRNSDFHPYLTQMVSAVDESISILNSNHKKSERSPLRLLKNKVKKIKGKPEVVETENVINLNRGEEFNQFKKLRAREEGYRLKREGIISRSRDVLSSRRLLGESKALYAKSLTSNNVNSLYDKVLKDVRDTFNYLKSFNEDKVVVPFFKVDQGQTQDVLQFNKSLASLISEKSDLSDLKALSERVGQRVSEIPVPASSLGPLSASILELIDVSTAGIQRSLRMVSQSLLSDIKKSS